MANITLPVLEEEDFAFVETLDDAFDILKNELNGQLDDTNIKAGADIDPTKIANGGCVTQNEITSTGEVSKIPKLDSNGDVVITGKIIFVEGLI